MRVLLLLLLCSAAILSAQEEGGEPLLYDAALTGWSVLIEGRGQVGVADQEHFVWEDSVLHVLPRTQAGSIQPFALLVTDSSYSRYDLHLEYRWGEKKFAPRDSAVRDAGVLYHVHDTTAFWAGSLECQIQEGDTGDAWIIDSRVRANINVDAQNFNPTDGMIEQRGSTGDRRYARVPRQYCWEQPGWNSIDLEVRGDSARYYVNGHLVNAVFAAEKPGATAGEWVPLRSGPVALQAEGAELYYRSVLLRPYEE
ncbi:3-keto-disaccharide hydrolase [Neolewinella sp.]|uniref:3-keto-disaccharide hydrolase n=1 Tax=Neolewinella sp. TaxID=2993543 RepID=UPI003B51A492